LVVEQMVELLRGLEAARLVQELEQLDLLECLARAAEYLESLGLGYWPEIRFVLGP
jgi:hypothetical protein